MEIRELTHPFPVPVVKSIQGIELGMELGFMFGSAYHAGVLAGPASQEKEQMPAAKQDMSWHDCLDEWSCYFAVLPTQPLTPHSSEFLFIKVVWCGVNVPSSHCPSCCHLLSSRVAAGRRASPRCFWIGRLSWEFRCLGDCSDLMSLSSLQGVF